VNVVCYKANSPRRADPLSREVLPRETDREKEREREGVCVCVTECDQVQQ